MMPSTNAISLQYPLLNGEELLDRTEALLTFGELMLMHGASSFRTDTDIGRIAQGFGIERVQTSFQFRALFITAYSGKCVLTASRVITGLKVDLNKVTQLNALSFNISEGSLDLQEFLAKLDVLRKAPLPYPNYVSSLIVACSCATLTQLNHGDLYAALVAFLSVFLGVSLKKLLLHVNLNQCYTAIACALVSGFITCTSIALGITGSQQALIFACILYLTPGVEILNGLLDILQGYLGNGIGRLVFALFVIIGMSAGLTFAALITEIQIAFYFPTIQPDPIWTTIRDACYIGIASIGLGFLFNAPLYTISYIALTGAVGHATLIYVVSIGLPAALGSFIGGAFVGILGVIFAHITSAPRLIFLVPPALLLGAGPTLLQAVISVFYVTIEGPTVGFELLRNSYVLWVQALLMMIGLGLGISIPSVLFRLTFTGNATLKR